MRIIDGDELVMWLSKWMISSFGTEPTEETKAIEKVCDAVGDMVKDLAKDTDGDLISRQAAIDAVDHICPVDTDYDCTLLDRVDVRYVLSDLPSAQPEKRTQERTETNSCDLISRQTAIDALAVEFYNCADDYRTAVKVIGGIPSAEPKRVKGRWVEMLSYMNHTYKCSECGRLLVNVTDGKNNVSKHYPYCHCGADMRGGSDETIAD